MKVLQTIIGTDLSKDTIDLVCFPGNNHLKAGNMTSGFRGFLKWIRQQKIDVSQMMLVMEHTGLYSYHFENFLHKKGISFTKIPALAIKRSLGLVRGKNDKVDAQRIARYGYEKRDQLKAESLPDETLKRLAMLHSTREKLVRDRASLKCSLKQYRGVVKTGDIAVRSRQDLISQFSKWIEKLEAEIRDLTASSESIQRTSELLRGIPGVGPVLSTATIIKTKNFTCFETSRKFCCYCGSAPFEHSSGTSIRRRTRISHLADKGMKTLLDQAAKSAIQHDKELKAFYQRRLEMGKSKKSTINIIRNKIIYRMFAVIKRGTPFVKDFLKTA
ncbi:MAG TPA: IS110 family transposase [Flavisolibacter sp.]